MPVSSETPSSSCRVASGISCGQGWLPIREIAAASLVTGLSSLRWEPWPAVPWAMRLSQARPFSAVWMR